MKLYIDPSDVRPWMQNTNGRRERCEHRALDATHQRQTYSTQSRADTIGLQCENGADYKIVNLDASDFDRIGAALLRWQSGADTIGCRLKRNLIARSELAAQRFPCATTH